MIDMSLDEMHTLALLLADEQDKAVTEDHKEQYAFQSAIRMWVIAAIEDGFWRVTGNTALLTGSSLDLLLLWGLDGEAAVLARRMSAHLKGLMAEYEAEMRKLQGMSRH